MSSALSLLPFRSLQGVSQKQLKQAASLLKAAAGVQYLEAGKSLPQDNSLIPEGTTTEILPDLHVASSTHTAALNKLAEIYLAGLILSGAPPTGTHY